MKLLKTAFFLIPFSNLVIFNNFNVSDLLFLLVFLISMSKSLYVKRNVLLIIVMLGLFIFLNLLSLLWVDNFSNVFIFIMQYVFIFIIIILSSLLNIQNRDDFIKVLKSFYYGLMTSIVLNLLLFIFLNDTYTTYHGRFFGIYNNPWIMSYVVVLAISITLFFTLKTSKVYVHLINLSLLIIEIYLLIVSGARTSFVALFFIFILFLFYLIKKYSSPTLMIIQTLFLIIFGLITLFYYQNIVKSILPFLYNISEVAAIKLETLTTDDLDTGRLNLYMSGLSLLYESPIGWIGLGNFSSVYGISMHNVFISLWLEAGLINAFIIIAMLLYIVFLLVKRSNEFETWVIISMILVLVIFGLFNPVLTLRIYWMPFVLAIIYLNFERKDV